VVVPNLLLVAACLAAAFPPLLAYNLSPSPTLLNQCLAFALWGSVVLVLAPGRLSGRGWPLQGALLALGAGVLWSWLPGHLPASIALSSLSLLAGAMLLAWAGTESARQVDSVKVFEAFAWGMLLAGLLSAVVACIQVFMPAWSDGAFIAHSGLVGRAVGNLRQPNHLCSLLLWSVIAAVALLELRRLSAGMALAAVLALVFAVELSASRTGAAGLVLLALWGALGKRMSRPTRWLLLATPLIYALSYGAMWGWGELTQHAVGAEARIATEATGIESPNSRSRIWANALALVAQQPWTGVGFGEFNLAWSLTAFPQRPTAFFDHTHNLPLQLVVELGVPLSLLVMGLLATALVLGWRRCRMASGDRHGAASAAWMMVLMIGLHSLVEYPLWYGYFLLPAAFAWGFSLGIPADEGLPSKPSPRGILAGAAMVTCAGLALVDYMSVVAIYAPGDTSVSLSDRIARGQRSPLFSYQGDYAAATTPNADADVALAFRRAPHFLMDTRLMVAWARHLADTGRIDQARWLAQRIREFRNADADEFFSACKAATPPASPSSAAGPEATDAASKFQCQEPVAPHDWREFTQAP
jgi:O-antigen ligase